MCTAPKTLSDLGYQATANLVQAVQGLTLEEYVIPFHLGHSHVQVITRATEGIGLRNNNTNNNK